MLALTENAFNMYRCAFIFKELVPQLHTFQTQTQCEVLWTNIFCYFFEQPLEFERGNCMESHRKYSTDKRALKGVILRQN